MYGKIIEAHVKKEKMPDIECPESFNDKERAFIILNKYPDHNLRGCIGYPEPHLELIKALKYAAKSSSTKDPQFLRVKADELDKIVVEVILLTPPVLIEVKNPKEYLDVIKIGRDGLFVEQGFYRISVQGNITLNLIKIFSITFIKYN